MNDNGSLTASDVALLTGNNNDGFGNGGWGGMIWLFAILALMGGGFGGNWGGGGYRPQALQMAHLIHQSQQKKVTAPVTGLLLR